jgi:urease subunit gamma/beta
VHLTPREQERVLLHGAAALARRRLARGAPLGAGDAIALVCDEICELAWDGVDLDEVVRRAREVVGPHQLVAGVAAAVPSLQVEALFPHGTTLVHVAEPFGPAADSGPGGVLSTGEDTALAPGRPRKQLTVLNTGLRPVWVSSHFPLEEVNPALEFDREAARGHRLDLPAGTSQEFGPGATETVTVVARGGDR